MNSALSDSCQVLCRSRASALYRAGLHLGSVPCSARASVQGVAQCPARSVPRPGPSKYGRSRLTVLWPDGGRILDTARIPARKTSQSWEVAGQSMSTTCLMMWVFKVSMRYLSANLRTPSAVPALTAS